MDDGSWFFKACDVVGYYDKKPHRMKLLTSWKSGGKEGGRIGSDVEISRMHHQ